jgi:alanine-synthesizing transaminase
VPGQWAVQTALGGYQSIGELIRPGGRLYQSRQSVIDAVASSPHLSLVAPMGAMYAFVRINPRIAAKIDDRQFAQELLETRHVLIAPGSSFNTPYRDHFRITILPDAEQIREVFDRIDSLLGQFL